jgi:hypothetical protein
MNEREILAPNYSPHPKRVCDLVEKYREAQIFLFPIEHAQRNVLEFVKDTSSLLNSTDIRPRVPFRLLPLNS